MRIKYSHIYLFLIVLLAFQSAYGQNEAADKVAQNTLFRQSDWRIENLVKQARELFEAYDTEDCAKFVELSHPKVYEKEGSKKFFDDVMLVIEDSSISYERVPSTVETPSELFEVNKQLFAVIPYKLEGVRKGTKDKIVALGSMVGVSEDGGKSWKFVKGVVFNEAFPSVAGMFLIPNPVEKRFLNGVEQ